MSNPRHLPARPPAALSALLCAALAACSGSSGSSSPRRIHVSAGAPGGGDGGSWSSAYADLQQALAAAAPGDEVWVAAGVYRPGAPGAPREARFLLRDGVALYGGFAGVEDEVAERDWLANETVLSGDLAGDDAPGFGNRGDNAYQVVVAIDVGAGTRLDGFTIEGGQADGPGFGAVPDSLEQGAGVNVHGGGPSIENCLVRDNFSANHGAINDHGETTRVVRCTFRGNRSLVLGAGLYVHHHAETQAIDCEFHENSTDGDGGGFYSRSEHGAMLEGALFVGNRANRGAGAYNSVGSATHVVDCTFLGNEAVTGGAGIYNDISTATIEGCHFEGNVAGTELPGGGAGEGGSGGGGVWASGGAITVADCTFRDNLASFGAGVYNIDGSEAVVEGCVFEDNLAREGTGLYAIGGAVSAVGCTFERNRAEGGDFPVGGAVSFYFTSSSVSGCLMRHNEAELGGGGIYVEGEAPRIDSCRLVANRAFGETQGWGGGLMVSYFCEPRVTNTTFVGNRARQGGGAFSLVLSAPTFLDCTFAANAAETGGALYSFFDTEVAVRNSILWGDLPDEVAGEPVAAERCCVAGGYPAGRAISSRDPSFLLEPFAGPDGDWGTGDDVEGDLRLAAGSSCVDAGDNALVPPDLALDLAGAPRIVDDPRAPDVGAGEGALVDLGAYERVP